MDRDAIAFGGIALWFVITWVFWLSPAERRQKRIEGKLDKLLHEFELHERCSTLRGRAIRKLLEDEDDST